MFAHAEAKGGHWASSSTSLQLICEPESLPELEACSFSWLAREFRACLSPHSSVTGGHRWIGLVSAGPGGLKSEPLVSSARTLCPLSCLLRSSGIFPVCVCACVYILLVLSAWDWWGGIYLNEGYLQVAIPLRTRNSLPLPTFNYVLLLR